MSRIGSRCGDSPTIDPRAERRHDCTWEVTRIACSPALGVSHDPVSPPPIRTARVLGETFVRGLTPGRRFESESATLWEG